MVFGIVIALMFGFIVYFHYNQGLLSSTISAVLAVISAVLAFSLHEWIVEKFLQGALANLAHAMILLVLFALIYSLLRFIFDKFVPNGIRLPVLLDRIGGAIMGLVAATYAMGIIAIAAQELPFSTAVAGYTKYATDDNDAKIQSQGHTGQMREGKKNDELRSNVVGSFDETERSNLFPWFLPGVDDIVVNTVGYLSSTGSLAGDQPLTSIHPDFLQEIFGQRAGIEAGAQHVVFPPHNPSEKVVQLHEVMILNSVFRQDDFIRATVREPHALEMPRSLKRVDGYPTTINKKPVQYFVPTNDPETGKKTAIIIVRLSFGIDACDREAKEILVRMSPGCVRLVANRPREIGGTPVPYNYYPIGELELAPDGPVLYAAKPDDSMFVDGAGRPGIDLVFAVDADDFMTKDGKVKPGAFIEFKRLFRQDLSGHDIDAWEDHKIQPGISLGMAHQKTAEDEVFPPPPPKKK